MADATVPLDEALASVALDISGRPFCTLDASWTLDRIGELPASLVEHLLCSIASEGKFTLHARVLSAATTTTTRRKRCARHLAAPCPQPRA